MLPGPTVSAPIGFAVMTHGDCEQLLRLCTRISALYGDPPIAVHHDFGRSPLDVSLFPPNVTFAKDWIPTRWGRFSLVEAALKAIATLYEIADPDWFLVLSGSDYPIAPPKQVLDELYSGEFDGYLNYQRVHYSAVERPLYYGSYCYDHPAWVREPYNRYMAVGLGFFKLAQRFKWKRDAFYLRWHRLVTLTTPFKKGVHCYAGDFWMTANREVARLLLSDDPLVETMRRHFSRRPIPDEGYFHSILLNAPGLRVCQDNRRYSDWSNSIGHPRVLGRADFEEMLSSGDYFARKLENDAAVLAELDALLDSRVDRLNRADTCPAA